MKELTYYLDQELKNFEFFDGPELVLYDSPYSVDVFWN